MSPARPWAASSDRHTTLNVTANAAAAILYTSGTTGRSKGAVLTHGNLRSNVVVLGAVWRWRDDDVLLHALPIFHVHGLFVALHCALAYASTIRFHERFDAAAVLRDLPQATVFMGVPTFYTRLLAMPGLDRAACRSIRLFISGSAPLLDATFDAFAERTGHTILERYGMTEALMITSNPYDGPRIAGSVGPALPGVAVRLAGGDAVANGEPGVLEIKGPNLFAGYWRNPAKTAEDHTADGWFITGDVATIDAGGAVRIVGRTKDLIISGGYNVYPKEIELAIDALPGVAESAVIGVPHPDFGEAVVAVVVRAPDHDPDPAAITAALARDSRRSNVRKGSSSSTNCRATRWARSRRPTCAAGSGTALPPRRSGEPIMETRMQLPKPVYKPPFNITRASHLVSRVRDLQASRAFYCDLLGLVISDETADTLWLRGLEEACHHSLVLKQGEPAVERIGMRVLTEEDLDLVAAHFAAAGFPTAWVEVPHQNRTLHTTDPAGTPLEFCATMETARTTLRPRRTSYHGACALRLDHFQIVTPKRTARASTSTTRWAFASPST